MKRPFSRRALHLAGAASLVLAVAAAAAAARDVIPGSSEQINACVKKSGKLRIVSVADACKSLGAARCPGTPAERPGRPGLPGRLGPLGRLGLPDADGAAGAGWTRRAGGCAGTGRSRRRRRAGKGLPGRRGPPGRRAIRARGLTSIDGLSGIACTKADGSRGNRGRRTPRPTERSRSSARGGGGGGDPGTSAVVINEIDYDQVGADSGGFVELHNGGTAAADLVGLALVLVDGSDGLEYARTNLTGTLAAGGHLSVAMEAQNGAPDGVALVDTASGTLLDALSYEGAITPRRHRLVGRSTSSRGRVLPTSVADSNTVTGSLIRFPDGSDTNDAATDWRFTTTPTPGAANVSTP